MKDGSTRLAEIADLASPAQAPMTLRFPRGLAMTFQAQRRASYPGGKALERGGTIVADADGRLELQNPGGLAATADNFLPYLMVANPAKYTLAGVFHTHPYDAADGWVNGVSFSGADLAYLIIERLTILLAQSGPRLFAALRTAQSPMTANYDTMDADQEAKVQALMTAGRNFQQASRTAAQQTASGLGLAYYQGAEGVMTRVSP